MQKIGQSAPTTDDGRPPKNLAKCFSVWQHFFQSENRNATMSDVPPTRMNQQIFKVKKKAAEGGHKLLKKKADALKVRFSRTRRGESIQEEESGV